ncbi:hypothetical protein UlMin_014234 [Ulmus minor]
MKQTGANLWRDLGVLRVLSYSTEALASSPPVDSLFARISKLGDPRNSIVPVLDKWVEEGRDIKKEELQRMIKQFRKFRRFSHALQMSEWMSDGMNFALSHGDMAVKLDLVSKVRGLEQAEQYFNSISCSSREKVYGALLNCYAEKDCLEKAEDHFQKMKELGLVKYALSYNVMLSLYSRAGEYEKLESLTREMEENGIKCDKFTICIRLNAYTATSNVEGMEKLLMKMEADPGVTMDCNAYFIAAKGYLKAGLPEKAVMMLRRAEQLIGSKEKRIAYEHLLTLYGTAGKKDEVYRIWNLYKYMGRVYNSGYISVLSSLVKLNDFDGIEKILEEWESGGTVFDIRIANLAISYYCKKSHLEKALAYADRLVNSGNELDARTWQCLATQCAKESEMERAVENLKKTVLARGRGWKLNRFTLAECLDYCKTKGDIEVAHEILGLLKEQGSLSATIYDRLLDYLKSEKYSRAIDAMEEDNANEKDDHAE